MCFRHGFLRIRLNSRAGLPLELAGTITPSGFEMEKNNDVALNRIPGLRIAGDLLWFTAASFGAGIMSALAAGALVILLA